VMQMMMELLRSNTRIGLLYADGKWCCEFCTKMFATEGGLLRHVCHKHNSLPSKEVSML
jgi:hypothetical protein